MKFVKIENIGDHEEIIVNIENISVLFKDEKFEMVCSDSPPYEYIKKKQMEGVFEYFVLLKNDYRIQLDKEDYDLIKSKIGL